jgi:hypothetical protein
MLDPVQAVFLVALAVLFFVLGEMSFKNSAARKVPVSRKKKPAKTEDHSLPPWYKENPFWGGVSGFCTFSLAGLGFAITGYPTLGKCLLWASFPWGVFAFWCMVNGRTQITKSRIFGRAAGFAIVGLVLWWSQSIFPKPTIQLAYYMVGLEQWVKPNTYARFVIFQQNGAAHFYTFGNGSDKAIDWTESKGTIVPPEFMGLITVSNHGFSQVFNLTMHISGTIENSKGFPKKTEISTDVMIDAIVPGQTIPIWVINQSDRSVDVILPAHGETEIQGEPDRKIVTLTNRTVLPFPLMPSWHTWNDNYTIGPAR